MSSESERETSGEGVGTRLRKISGRVDTQVRRSVNETIETASKAVANTLESVDERTMPGQLAALRAYRSFLGRQERATAARLSELEKLMRAGP